MSLLKNFEMAVFVVVFLALTMIVVSTRGSSPPLPLYYVTYEDGDDPQTPMVYDVYMDSKCTRLFDYPEGADRCGNSNTLYEILDRKTDVSNCSQVKIATYLCEAWCKNKGYNYGACRTFIHPPGGAAPGACQCS